MLALCYLFTAIGATGISSSTFDTPATFQCPRDVCFGSEPDLTLIRQTVRF